MLLFFRGIISFRPQSGDHDLKALPAASRPRPHNPILLYICRFTHHRTRSKAFQSSLHQTPSNIATVFKMPVLRVSRDPYDTLVGMTPVRSYIFHLSSTALSCSSLPVFRNGKMFFASRHDLVGLSEAETFAILLLPLSESSAAGIDRFLLLLMVAKGTGVWFEGVSISKILWAFSGEFRAIERHNVVRTEANLGFRSSCDRVFQLRGRRFLLLPRDIDGCRYHCWETEQRYSRGIYRRLMVEKKVGKVVKVEMWRKKSHKLMWKTRRKCHEF